MRAEQYLLVMDNGRVQGILTVDELQRYIRARSNVTQAGGKTTSRQ